MTYTIQIRNGQLNVEKALEAMDFDVVKFEAELKMLTDHQSIVMRKKLLNQYVAYMRGCGFTLDVRGVGKITPKIEADPEVKQEITPEITVKTETEPEPSYEKVAAEASALVETQKEDNPPETVPLPQPVSESEKKSETPKETTKAETAKTDSKASATAYFSFSDANLFKKLYDSMALLVKGITWKVTKEGISMRQMDPSRVAMIDLTIGKENCTEFNVTTPGTVTFYAETIKKQVFAKPFLKGTSIGIKIDGVIGRIAFILKDSATRERSFVTLEAEDNEDIPTPKISYTAKCKVVSKQIAADIKELEKMSDHITIIATTDSLKMQANGDCGNGENTYQRGDDNLLDIEVKEKSKAKFSFNYLKNLIQPALSELALLEFSTDMPIKITLLTKFGNLTYYIAPRVETE